MRGPLVTTRSRAIAPCPATNENILHQGVRTSGGVGAECMRSSLGCNEEGDYLSQTSTRGARP
jgi:hypothetical protein